MVNIKICGYHRCPRFQSTYDFYKFRDQCLRKSGLVCNPQVRKIYGKPKGS
jgi:hypothetical protein